MKTTKNIFKEAIQLNRRERFLLIDNLIKTIDEPNLEIDSIWLDEAEKRLESHRRNPTSTVSFEDVFHEDS